MKPLARARQRLERLDQELKRWNARRSPIISNSVALETRNGDAEIQRTFSGFQRYLAGTESVGRSEILALAGPGIEFPAVTMRELLGPIVYVWVRGDRALYVGMSTRGISRLGGHHRLVLTQIEETDALLVYPCQSAKYARTLEETLIRALCPSLNKQGTRRRDLMHALGLSRAHAGRLAQGHGV